MPELLFPYEWLQTNFLAEKSRFFEGNYLQTFKLFA